MAANSGTSAKNDKQLTKQDTLDILERAIHYVKRAGIEVKITNFYRSGDRSLAIVLENVELVDGELLYTPEPVA